VNRAGIVDGGADASEADLPDRHRQEEQDMFFDRNELPAEVATMVAILNARLADAIDLRTHAKVAHWNVKGPQFIALHELFDRLAHELDEQVDLIAERAVQLGGVARGTVRQVAAATELEEYAASGGPDELIGTLGRALAFFGWGVRQTIEAASAAGDHGTADLFTDLSRAVDKWRWMVDAHLHRGQTARIMLRQNEARVQ
jgi:starvation-inducible DNA-binding protein